MPSASAIEKHLLLVRSNVKRELDELQLFVDAHPSLMLDMEKPSGENFVDTGSVLNLKIQKTGLVLLQEIDDFINALPTKRKNVPVRPNLGQVPRKRKSTTAIRRRNTKTTPSS